MLYFSKCSSCTSSPPGVLTQKAYTGRLCLKRYLFQASGIRKGRESNQLKSNHWFIVRFAVGRLNCRIPYKLWYICRGYYTVAWRYEFHFRVAKQYFTNERNEWVKYCFCHEKIKFISSSRRIMFFLLYRQKDIDKIIEGNDRNYVIDKLTCEIMENKPLGSRMLFLWILRVVYFPVEHSCLYNKY